MNIRMAVTALTTYIPEAPYTLFLVAFKARSGQMRPCEEKVSAIVHLNGVKAFGKSIRGMTFGTIRL